MDQALRLVYAAGPGNVLGTYRNWQEGRDDPSQVSMTYSGQFYDVCKEFNDRGYVIASCPTPGRLQDERMRIRHRPVPFQDGPGPLYHLGQIWSGLRLALSALRFHADVVIVSSGACHWFTLGILPWFGVKVVPSLHCVLWAKSRPPSRVARWVLLLDRRFFRRSILGFLTASGAITEQVVELTKGAARSSVEFLPTYRRSWFEGIAPPAGARRPFRVLFAGRIEKNKGVFDLLTIAERFAAAGRTDIEFDLCGTGSVLEELRRRAAEAGLESRFRSHGHCSRSTMHEMFATSHVVIVPTTTEFVEGFNQVVAEGVLSGRPVITSNVCPALEYVRQAVVEVAPDDVQGYGDTILKLCDDGPFYQARCQGCLDAQGQFYDPERGWGAALKRILAPVREQKSKAASKGAKAGVS